jgi:hypothetical protein
MLPTLLAPATFRKGGIIAIGLLLAAGNVDPMHSQESNAPAAVPAKSVGCPGAFTPPQKIGPEAWHIENNVYTNDFYGLSYEFPKGWFVHESAVQRELAQKRKHADPPNPNDKLAYAGWLAIQCTHLLLEVRQDPEADEGNKSRFRVAPRIELTVYDPVLTEGLTTARDWFAEWRKHLDDNIYIVREPTDYVFSDQLFCRMDTRYVVPPIEDKTGAILAEAQTKYNAIVMGVRSGYWIQLNIIADNPQQLEELFQTLNSLRFK